MHIEDEICCKWWRHEKVIEKEQCFNSVQWETRNLIQWSCFLINISDNKIFQNCKNSWRTYMYMYIYNVVVLNVRYMAFPLQVTAKLCTVAPYVPSLILSQGKYWLFIHVTFGAHTGKTESGYFLASESDCPLKFSPLTLVFWWVRATALWHSPHFHWYSGKVRMPLTLLRDNVVVLDTIWNFQDMLEQQVFYICWSHRQNQ